jgi:antitoxin component of MazEF toxin-antitoxin module
MIKTISKVGNSQGIIFDSALMEMAHLKPGDDVNVEVHEGGTITLTLIRSRPSRGEVSKVIKSMMKDYARTMKKLARKPTSRVHRTKRPTREH